MSKQTARLKNWRRYHHGNGALSLVGTVYGHPKLTDGREIITSRVVDLDERLGIAVTLNTVYILRDTDVDGDVKVKEKEAA